MNRKILSVIFNLLLPVLIIIPGYRVAQPASSTAMTVTSKAAPHRIIVYKNNFDKLTTGVTQPFPGAAGQDGWFSELAVSPGYGEIQSDITIGRRALHEFTSSSVPNHYQTIDKRLLTPPDLSQYPLLTLRVDFYAHTSDLAASNIFNATVAVNGGPHPGFEILAFNVYSGNGIPKQDAGVNIGLNLFNGVDNNEPIPLAVGQNLAWDTWHSVILVADHAGDHYVSLKVDGKSEDLSAYALPRSFVDESVWMRGQLMEELIAVIIPNSDFEGASDDDIYWDRLQVTVEQGRR